MSDPFHHALASLTERCFEVFHASLARYLEVAGDFWRQTRDLGEALMDPAAEGMDTEVVMGLFQDLLGTWEDVAAQWKAVARAGAEALAELPERHVPAFSGQMDLLRQEYDRQTAGMQALVDIAAAVEAPGGLVFRELAEA